MNASRLITLFNNGGTDADLVLRIFGSTTNFVFKYLKPKKMVHKLDLDQIWDHCFYGIDEYKFNEICLVILDEVGPNYFLSKIPMVNVVDDKYYFQFYNFRNLDAFFSENDYPKFQKMENLDYVSESEIDFYYDILKQFTPENKRYLKNFILENFGSINLDLGDFEFNQGSVENYFENGTFNIRNNIDEILRTDHLFLSVLYTDTFEGLRENLLSLYNFSYKKNIYDNWKKTVLNSLSEIFYPKIYNGGYLKFVDFNNFLRNFFECFSNYKINIFDTYGPDDMLREMTYHGCIEQLELDDEISSSNIKNIINDYISEYI
jgi:hypothetical protein